MPGARIKNYLDAQRVRYVTITHSPAFTAQEIAESTHLPGRELAKSVIVMLDGQMAMAVVPAHCKVAVDLLCELTGAVNIRLATEKEFRERFPDCETGAMPPFGNLYDMDVYVAENLGRNDQIAFNAGSHAEVIRMSYDDFERLVQPQVLSFTY